MNTTYQYSPEQRKETPDAVAKRLQTTEFAKLFIETAINYYGNAVPEAAKHFPGHTAVKAAEAAHPEPVVAPPAESAPSTWPVPASEEVRRHAASQNSSAFITEDIPASEEVNQYAKSQAEMADSARRLADIARGEN